MRKLFSLKDCSEGEPLDPGPGSTSDEVAQYNNDWAAWFNGCVRELNPPVPQGTPQLPIDEFFADNNGFAWLRNVNVFGVDFRLDMQKSKKTSLHLAADAELIISLQVTFGNYTITTVSKNGIAKHTILRNKVRVSRLLSIICDHGSVSKEPWKKSSAVVETNHA
jgi:hypothetical protein